MSIKSNSITAIIPLFLVMLIDAMGWGVVFPVFEPIIIGNATHMFAADTSIAWRNFYYEFIIAIYCIFMFLGAPLLGSLSDRYGRKIILQISLAGTTIGYLLYVFGAGFNSFLMIVIGRVIAGATAGSFPVAQAAIVDVSTPEQLPKRFGLIGIASCVGFAIGPVIGGVFLDQNIFPHTNYMLPFLFCFFLLVMGLILLSRFYNDVPYERPVEKIDWLTGFKNIQQAFVGNKTRQLFVSFFLSMLAYTFFFCLLPLHMSEELNQTGSQIGYYMTFLSIMAAISLLFIAPMLIKRYSLMAIIFLGLIMQLIAFIGFIFAHDLLWMWLAGGLVSLFEPCSYIASTTLISNATDKDQQGKVMGVIGSVAALTWGAGPLCTGIAASKNLSLGFMVASAIMLCSIFPLLGFKPKNRG